MNKSQDAKKIQAHVHPNALLEAAQLLAARKQKLRSRVMKKLEKNMNKDAKKDCNRVI